MALDAAVALAAGLIALRGRYDSHGHVPAAYIVLTVSLPVIWLGTLALAGAYEPRFIGAGADEFRRVINAGLGLTSAIAILSYATRAEVSRSYVLMAMPCAVGIDLVARYALRKRLHRLRDSGACMRRAVAVGHPDLSGLRQVIKSLFDKVAAASALLLLAPLLLTIALMIRLEDGGPALFKQVRVGKAGRPFRLYKFRTMVPEAEQQKAALHKHNEGARVLFK